MERRTSIIAVTENDESRYCETTIYGGLGGIVLRFCRSAHDEHGNVRKFFDRLDGVEEMSKEAWDKIHDDPASADDYYSFIIINADNNMVYADEDWPEERSYAEIPLDKLLEASAPLIKEYPPGLAYIDKKMLYARIKDCFYPKNSNPFPHIGWQDSLLAMIHAGMPPRRFNDPRKRERRSTAVDRD